MFDITEEEEDEEEEDGENGRLCDFWFVMLVTVSSQVFRLVR